MSSFKLVIAVITFILVNLSIPATAEACSCMPPDLVRTTNESDHVMVGKVVRKRKKGQTRYFELEINRTFKGCFVAGSSVILRSPVSGATCGINLAKNRRYLITGYDSSLQNGNPAISINSCGHIYEWQTVPQTDRAFLNSRYVDCPSQGVQQCADGTMPMSCTVDPCSTYNGTCTGCVANYCGGCNREFYDANGDAICETEWTVTPPN